jgi:hypothetical protein
MFMPNIEAAMRGQGRGRGQVVNRAGARTPREFFARETRVSDTAAASEKRCRRCGEVKPLEGFPPAPRIRDGRNSWCRTCYLEATRQWRAAHREYEEAYNAARRPGPFPSRCRDCLEMFPASRRMQVRCPSCQAAMRRARRR